MKRIATAAALVILSSAALAQEGATTAPEGAASERSGAQQDEAPLSPAPSSASDSAILVPIDADEQPVPALNLMAGQVADMQVVGADDKLIGEVADILGDQNGEPRAIVVEAGGFLGMGERRIILMLDQVQLDMGRLRTRLTEGEISDLPEYQG